MIFIGGVSVDCSRGSLQQRAGRAALQTLSAAEELHGRAEVV